MTEDVIFGKKIFQTEKDTMQIFDSFYHSVPCYCVYHRKTDFKVLFDYDEKVLKAVIHKIKRTGITYDKKKSGSGFMFKFHNTKREKSITLRNFLFAKYNNYSLDKARELKVKLYDTSSYADKIMDMRSSNLYEAGGFRPENIEIVNRPNNPDEKYLIVRYNERIEIQDYSQELFNILATRNLCNCSGASKHNGRLTLVVHYAKSRDAGYKVMNLSRFVLLFYKNYNRYERTSGATKRFIHSIPALTEALGEDIHCGHVNACNWNNTSNNIVPMDNKLNTGMHSYITYFTENYDAFPIAINEDGKDVILLEFVTNGTKQFYKFTLEEYCDFQRVMVGREDITKNLKLSRILISPESDMYMQFDVDTPKQAHKRVAGQREDVEKDTLSEFWTWCDRRDALLEKYHSEPGIFRTWKNLGERDTTMFDLNQVISAMTGITMDSYGIKIETLE